MCPQRRRLVTNRVYSRVQDKTLDRFAKWCYVPRLLDVVLLIGTTLNLDEDWQLLTRIGTCQKGIVLHSTISVCLRLGALICVQHAQYKLNCMYNICIYMYKMICFQYYSQCGI